MVATILILLFAGLLIAAVAYAIGRAQMRSTMSAVSHEVVQTTTAANTSTELGQWYTALFDSSFDAIILTDHEGRITARNTATEKLLGYSAEEAIGQHIDFLHPVVNQDQGWANIARVMADAMGTRTDVELAHKDGRSVSLPMTPSPLQVSTGEVLGIALVARHVLDQGETEELFHLAVESMPSGMVMVDEAGTIVLVNAEMERLFGYSRQELIGMPVDALLPKRYQGHHPKLRQDYHHATEKRAMGEGRELHAMRKDGTEFPVEVGLNPAQSSQAGLVLAVIIDISARRRQEELFHLAVEALPSGMIMVNRDGTIMLVNAEMERLFGYTREEFDGMPVEKLIPGRFQARHPHFRDEYHRAPHKRTMGEGRELYAMRKDGTEFPVEVGLNPAHTFDSGVVLAVIIDITARKRTEEHLRQSQKMEVIGQLAGGVAHDFNNLISVINGYADFVIDGLPEDSLLRQDAHEIRKAGERAASLTQQLLAYSRKQVLQPEVLDLHFVVREQQKLLSRLIGENIECSIIAPHELGRVLIDRGQLDQVIMNLALNARDAMPRGGKLTFELQDVDLDEEYVEEHVRVAVGSYVLMAVSDTGAGMDKETLAQIFEPFFTTKERGRGTGMGLSTIYGIINQSNGYIFAYSEPGRGSVFKIYLPRAGDAPASVRLSPHPGEAHGSETIMLVEDEESLRTLSARILMQAGYQVISAESATKALEMLEDPNIHADLLLTDVVMPGMSGPELVERIATDRPQLRVLYMSGYTDDTIVHHGVLSGGTHFINKPYSGPQLVRKVRSLLDDASL